MENENCHDGKNYHVAQMKGGRINTEINGIDVSIVGLAEIVGCIGREENMERSYGRHDV